MRGVAIMFGATALTACAAPYEAQPASVYQWEHRQQEIERREAERLRLCQTLDQDSARYRRDCASGVNS